MLLTFLQTDWMMGALLAALSVGGLLIGFLLLYVRFARIEELLSRLQEITTLTEEIRELKKAMSQVSSAQIEDHLEGLVHLNKRSVRVMEAVYEETSELNARMTQRQTTSVRDLIERRFFNQGYTAVDILSDLDELDEEPYRVQIEAVRGGISYKGTVTVQNDAVVESTLKPSYEMFP